MSNAIPTYLKIIPELDLMTASSMVCTSLNGNFYRPAFRSYLPGSRRRALPFYS